MYADHLFVSAFYFVGGETGPVRVPGSQNVGPSCDLKFSGFQALNFRKLVSSKC